MIMMTMMMMDDPCRHQSSINQSHVVTACLPSCLIGARDSTASQCEHSQHERSQSCSSPSSISSCSIIITIIFDRQPGPHWRHGFSALSKLPAEREPTYLPIYLPIATYGMMDDIDADDFIVNDDE